MNFRILLVAACCGLSIITGLVIAHRGGPAESSAKNKTLRIGLSLDTLKEERWQGDRDIFVKRAKELGADVIVQSANGDDTRQIHDVESLITQKIDVLVIVHHHG